MPFYPTERTGPIFLSNRSFVPKLQHQPSGCGLADLKPRRLGISRLDIAAILACGSLRTCACLSPSDWRRCGLTSVFYMDKTRKSVSRLTWLPHRGLAVTIAGSPQPGTPMNINYRLRTRYASKNPPPREKLLGLAGCWNGWVVYHAPRPPESLNIIVSVRFERLG